MWGYKRPTFTTVNKIPYTAVNKIMPHVYIFLNKSLQTLAQRPLGMNQLYLLTMTLQCNIYNYQI